MKIAVCVKAVPDAAAGRKLDPSTGRLDRSGDLAVSDFDLHPVEEALRVRDAAGEGEVVVVSLGPAGAADAVRKTLAMGADRSVLVSDAGFEGGDLVTTARALAGALGREEADLVLFGQQSADGDGACLWAAVAELLACAGDLAGRRALRRRRLRHGRRQTEHGYERIRAPLPAVVAVSDAINEPRYPSLKGIMGAKSKPQETLVASDVGGVEAARTTVLGQSPPPSRGDRRRVEGAGAPGGDPRVPRGEAAPVKTLVFLEHDGDALTKPALAVLSKAAALGGEVAGVVAGSGVAGIAEGAGASVPRPCSSPTTSGSPRLCRSHGSTSWRRSSVTRGSTPSCSRSPCSRPTSLRGSRRASGPA